MLLLVDICITVIDACICNINNNNNNNSNNNNNNDNVLSEELLCKRDSQIKNLKRKKKMSALCRNKEVYP